MGRCLARAVRGPMTWWLHSERDQITVVCSAGHRSMLQHHVLADGALRSPPGCAGSMHCGRCNEDLPLFLADWPPGQTWTGPRPEYLPPESVCARCGARSRFLGGWGICGTYVGVICAACFAEVVKP